MATAAPERPDVAARAAGPPKAPRVIKSVTWYAALVGLTVLFLAPLLWMFTTSVKTEGEATRVPPTWIPEEFSFRGFDLILDPGSQTPVFRWLVNSLLAGAAHTVLVLATASLAAYALARLDFPGKRILTGAILATLFIPPFVLLIPNYLIVADLGWLDTLWALIIPTSAGAFGVFFLRQFFLTLPAELEEAALLDGANQFQIFTRIVLPLSKPALATLAVLSFLANWNDFLWPVYVLLSPENFTLPPGLSILQGAYVIDYPVIMAGAVLTSVPVLILFVLTQRYVIEGVSRSGLKG